MTVYLGGFQITDSYWDDSTGLVVTFTSGYSEDDYYHQLYVGRQLIGVTDLTSDRLVTGPIDSYPNPEEIQLVAVDYLNRETDHGSLLPPRPYARVKLTITTVGWSDETRFIEITAGTVPGGAVDLDNVIGLIPWTGNGTYTFLTRPMTDCGTWNFEAAGRDDTLPDGNRGTAIAISADVIVYPEDVDVASDGTRMQPSITGGVLTVTFTEPS